MNSRKTWIAVLLLFAVASAGGALWYRLTRPQEVQPEEFVELAQEIGELSQEPDSEEKTEKVEAAKDKLAGKLESFLTSQLRGMLEQSAKQEGEMAEKFFGLSPEEQVARLDEMIAEQDKAGSEMRSTMPAADSPPGTNKVDVTNKKEGKGAVVSMTKDAKSLPGLDKLDPLSMIPPKQRALVADLDRRLAERRKERGLPPSTVKVYSIPSPLGMGQGKIQMDIRKTPTP